MSENPLKGLEEPAAMLGAGRSEGERSKAARRWDLENRPTSYRLDPSVPERVREIQAWYKERGHTVTQGQLVEDLLLHAFEAWKRGEIAVNVEETSPTRRAVRRESG